MKVVTSWILRILAAAIMAQTLFFKFAGAAESKAIFIELGVEPFGRILTGVLELIAVALLLIPRTVPHGAILTLGLMSGAIISHVTNLGFEGDRGQLFLLAAVTWVSALALLFIHKDRIPIPGSRFANSARSE